MSDRAEARTDLREERPLGQRVVDGREQLTTRGRWLVPGVRFAMSRNRTPGRRDVDGAASARREIDDRPGPRDDHAIVGEQQQRTDRDPDDEPPSRTAGDARARARSAPLRPANAADVLGVRSRRDRQLLCRGEGGRVRGRLRPGRPPGPRHVRRAHREHDVAARTAATTIVAAPRSSSPELLAHRRLRAQPTGRRHQPTGERGDGRAVVRDGDGHRRPRVRPFGRSRRRRGAIERRRRACRRGHRASDGLDRGGARPGARRLRQRPGDRERARRPARSRAGRAGRSAARARTRRDRARARGHARRPTLHVHSALPAT